MKRIKIVIGFVILPLIMMAQVVYEPVVNNPVYELLDELAALRVITINSVVKPYSKVFIAEKLKEAELGVRSEELRVKVSKRVLEEILFYLKDYGFELRVRSEELGVKNNNSQLLTSNSKLAFDPLAYRYSGNVFKMSVSPWLGGRFMINENGNVNEFSGGVEVFGYIGKHIGYYANVKYTWQSEPLVNPVMFTLEEGKSWNYLGNGSVQNTEWRGGLSVGWRWGDFGIYKDRPVWGSGVHGTSVMSGHPPSFPYIQLHLKPAKWIEFYCMTGFLKSNVVDSSRSNFETGAEQIKYHRKYMSANFFTITPWKGLNISLGNSIFWCDVFKVGYLMPFNLYKSVDETLKGTFAYTDGINTNDDGHLFFDITSRNIKHLNLYVGLWIDDWVSSYVFDPNKTNCIGWKLGVGLYDLPVKNLIINFEGTINRPRVYQQYNPVTAFTNDDYSFGNWLRDDSWEVYICATYKPMRGLNISASYNIAQRGGFIYMKDDYTTYPLSKNLIFNQRTFEINLLYQILTNAQVFAGYKNQQHSGDVQYIPGIFNGITNSMNFGFVLGF